LKGMTPLSNRSGATASDPLQPPTQETMTSSNPEPSVPSVSSVPPSPDVTLQNRATEAELRRLRQRNAELEATHSELLAAQIEHDLARFSAHYKPEAHEKWRAALLANRPGILELLESLHELPSAPALHSGHKSTNLPIHNRSAATTPSQGISLWAS